MPICRNIYDNTFCSKSIIYTRWPRRNMPGFGRVFLMLKYTDITQNTYVQSWTVTEIMAREKCGLLAGQRGFLLADNLIHFRPWVWCHMTAIQLTLATELHAYFLQGSWLTPECAVSHVTSPLGILMYSAWNPKDNYDMSASVFVVQFNGFMSLTS